MKCEYAGCNKKATRVLKIRGGVLIRYCKKHMEEIIEEIKPWGKENGK